MKMTRLCGLVVLAVVAVLIFSVPAQALDHPWDGTKLVDTTNLSNPNGTNSNPNDGGLDGGRSIAPTQSWYTAFVGWITGLFSNNQAEKIDQVSDFEAVKSRPEGKEESLSKFRRK